MKNAPNIVRLSSLTGKEAQEGAQACINGQWVPARPLGYYSFKNRLKCAWMVFTGRADALVWPEDYENQKE